MIFYISIFKLVLYYMSILSHRQQVVQATDVAIRLLQEHPDVAKYGNSDGYLYIPTFVKLFESTTCLKLTDELLSDVKANRNIMINPKCPDYIRAAFGHSGPVLAYMLSKTHTVYTGPRLLFAFTHFSMDGLGVLNSGRSVNMLIAPEYLANKGVKAYVNIKTLAENGIQVWKQNGDLHTGRVFCYSPNILNFVLNVDLSSDYLKEDNLYKIHNKLIDAFKIIYAHLDIESFEKTVKKKLIKLIVVDEDDVEEISEIVDSIDTQIQKLNM